MLTLFIRLSKKRPIIFTALIRSDLFFFYGWCFLNRNFLRFIYGSSLPNPQNSLRILYGLPYKGCLFYTVIKRFFVHKLHWITVFLRKFQRSVYGQRKIISSNYVFHTLKVSVIIRISVEKASWIMEFVRFNV